MLAGGIGGINGWLHFSRDFHKFGFCLCCSVCHTTANITVPAVDHDDVVIVAVYSYNIVSVFGLEIFFINDITGEQNSRHIQQQMKAHTTKTSVNASTIIYLPPFCYPCKHVPATPTTTTATTKTKTQPTTTATATATVILTAAAAAAPGVSTATTTTITAATLGVGGKVATAGAKTSATGSGNVTTTTSTSTMAIAMTLASVGNTGGSGVDGVTGDVSNGSGYGSCCQRCRWEHKNYDKHATPTLTPTTTARTTFATTTTTTELLRRPALSNVEATALAGARAAATTEAEVATRVEGELKDKGGKQEENRITRNTSRVGVDIVGGEGAGISSCSCCIHRNFLQQQQNQQQQQQQEQLEEEKTRETKLQQQRIAMTDTDIQCSENSDACSKKPPSDLKQTTRQQQHSSTSSVVAGFANIMADVHHVDAVQRDDDDDDDDDDDYDDDDGGDDEGNGNGNGNVNEKRAVDVSWFLADSIKLRNIQLVMPIDAVGVEVVDAAECRLENVTTVQHGTSTTSNLTGITKVDAASATATTTTTAAAAFSSSTSATVKAKAKAKEKGKAIAESTTAAAATRQSYASLTQNNAAAIAKKIKTETTINTATARTTIKKASHTTTTPLLDECRCFKYNGDISTLEEISGRGSSMEDCCCEQLKTMLKVNPVEKRTVLVGSPVRYEDEYENETNEKKELRVMQTLKDYQHSLKLKQQNERKLPRHRSSRIPLLKFWQQPQQQGENKMPEQQLVPPESQEATMAATPTTATTTTTTTTTTLVVATPTASAVSRCTNLVAYAAKTMTAAKAMAIRTITTTTKTTIATTTKATKTKSWITLLVMLMLTTSANCWGGRQDVPTNCTFPARWEGSWFLSGYQQSIHIKGSQFSYRGRCAASDGNKYLIVDEKGCHRCLVIYEKHKNVLQYKESECEGDSMYMHQSNPSALAMRSSLKQSDHRGGAHPNTNGHSRLSSSDQYIMRSNDDMNDYFCKGRETLQNLCDQIPGDALLYSLFRESAEPVKCPLKGPFIFTYNRGHGECKSPVSNIESCTEESRLLLSFQACPDVQGTESTVEELTCLATWKDGNSRYLVGLVSHHHAISNEERYRCFVYEKISSLMGGPSMLSSKDAEYKLAQSGDATCNGLDSAEVGSRIMSLRKPPLAERCDFPVWFKGPRHWHALMGNAVYNFHSNDGSVHIIKPNGYMETRALCEQINKQTATEMMAVVHYTTGCQSGFMCMMFYRRDTHVIEIQTGKPAIRLEDACAPEYFDINKMAYITLLASNPDPQICPMEGLYNLRGAIGPPYLTTRHKRNHNNKMHLGHGHHHHEIDAGGSIGFGHKRHSTLSFRNAERMEKDSWHGNTRGLPVRSRRNANELKKENPVESTKQLLLGVSNDTSVGFVSRSRRDVPSCVTNYKAQRQLWIGCTAPNVIDVRPLCNEEGEEEYSCHGSWIDNGTVYIIARHKSTKHGVCISYRPTEGIAAKLVIGDACYRGTQKPPDHHMVSNLSVFGKCGETGSGSTHVHIANWLLWLAVCMLFALLLADSTARTLR